MGLAQAGAQLAAVAGCGGHRRAPHASPGAPCAWREAYLNFQPPSPAAGECPHGGVLCPACPCQLEQPGRGRQQQEEAARAGWRGKSEYGHREACQSEGVSGCGQPVPSGGVVMNPLLESISRREASSAGERILHCLNTDFISRWSDRTDWNRLPVPSPARGAARPARPAPAAPAASQGLRALRTGGLAACCCSLAEAGGGRGLPQAVRSVAGLWESSSGFGEDADRFLVLRLSLRDVCPGWDCSLRGHCLAWLIPRTPVRKGSA